MQSNDVESVKPYNEDEDKGKQISRMFDTISPAYDLMNRIISLGQDGYWRRSAINEIAEYRNGNILDIATGTGDMAFMIYEMLSPESVTGCDISEGMLQVAEMKAARTVRDKRISFCVGDCSALPFDDGKFDAATVAFGVRNFKDLLLGLTEISRVLKPGGKVSILELTVPENRLYRLGYDIYTKTVIPLLGKIITGDSKAYGYLGKSIHAMPQGKKMLSLLEKAGFTDCSFRYMTLGACAVYTGIIPANRS